MRRFHSWAVFVCSMALRPRMRVATRTVYDGDQVGQAHAEGESCVACDPEQSSDKDCRGRALASSSATFAYLILSKAPRFRGYRKLCHVEGDVVARPHSPQPCIAGRAGTVNQWPERRETIRQKKWSHSPFLPSQSTESPTKYSE